MHGQILSSKKILSIQEILKREKQMGIQIPVFPNNMTWKIQYLIFVLISTKIIKILSDI